jgi:cytochrome c peroxidase
VKRLAFVLVLAACGHGHDSKQTIEPAQKKDAQSHLLAADDAAPPEVPAAAPLPIVPAGLPAVTQPASVTPDAVALGEALFRDARLASDGKTSCATCHDPAHGFAGAGRQSTATGQPNLRRAPALVNLAWKKEFAWDGRYPSLDEQLPAHAKGQLGRELAESVSVLDADPVLHVRFTRAGGVTPETALAALEAYVLTRYAGDSAWDRVERSPDAPADLKAGYALFTGKAQCGVCHTPPLYTDLGYHRLGLIAIHDEGRGRIDKAQTGAFATPTLRGAVDRAGFFHDGSAPSLDAAIDWHLAGGTGQGADKTIVDIKPVALSTAERAQLGTFVRALTAGAK